MSDVSKPPPSDPQAIPPPPGIPQPTGKLRTDVYNSMTNILQVPCAKNAFMQGLVSGVGVGFIRGTTAAPIVAGHWAITTFVGISGVSWYICHRRMAKEREKVIQMIESSPKRSVKHEDSEST
ncbi:hypothetical protein EDD18DRAFT_1345032 [Armillaria luteobubalina]|uniref:Cytochrome c oxidase assembly protein COX20, mitochondrial n=1 Tax=Armillaria luteobubalina TaxID=153913 RepID=A0AA39UZ52_9AGAR|nr:hypothetical protein EDD18DRAFT_1345032 [Armillaria luteobubalina]